MSHMPVQREEYTHNFYLLKCPCKSTFYSALQRLQKFVSFFGKFCMAAASASLLAILHAFVFVFRSLSMTLRYRRQDYYNLIRWREGHIGKMIAKKEQVIRKSCKFKLEFFSPESVECFSKRTSNWSQRLRSKINVSYLWYCGKVIRDHVIYPPRYTLLGISPQHESTFCSWIKIFH